MDADGGIGEPWSRTNAASSARAAAARRRGSSVCGARRRAPLFSRARPRSTGDQRHRDDQAPRDAGGGRRFGKCHAAPRRRRCERACVEESPGAERPDRVGRVRRVRVRRRQRAAPRRGIEGQPAMPGEPGLDPGVGIVIGHRPRAVLPRSAREPDGDPGRNAEVPEHQRHRSGELLAVAELRANEEVDERRLPERAGGCSS